MIKLNDYKDDILETVGKGKKEFCILKYFSSATMAYKTLKINLVIYSKPFTKKYPSYNFME